VTKKKPITPRSRIRSALRQLFLRSRERAEAIKRDHYSCQICGAKQSRAKGKEVFVEVHHTGEISNWDKVIDSIYSQILCRPEDLVTLCKDCHHESHNGKG